MLRSVFCAFGVGACALQRKDTEALNSVQITYPGAHLPGKHSNNTRINDFPFCIIPYAPLPIVFL